MERAYISVSGKKHRMLRFSPWKVLEHIKYEHLSESRDTDSKLLSATIETKDSWSRNIVLSTSEEIVSNRYARLPDDDGLVIVEAVGQRIRPFKV